MAALLVLGHWLEDSRWSSALMQANIVSPGVVNSFLKSSNVKRTWRADQVTAAALYSLLRQAYDEYKQTETLEEVLSFSDWCKRKTQASPQFHFWYVALQLELLYLLFLRSQRTSSLPLYHDVLQKLTPWFLTT